MAEYRLIDDLNAATEALRRATCALAQASAAARMEGADHRALDNATRCLDSALGCVELVAGMVVTSPVAASVASALRNLGAEPGDAMAAATAAAAVAPGGDFETVLRVALRR